MAEVVTTTLLSQESQDTVLTRRHRKMASLSEIEGPHRTEVTLLESMQPMKSRRLSLGGLSNFEDDMGHYIGDKLSTAMHDAKDALIAKGHEVNDRVNAMIEKGQEWMHCHFHQLPHWLQDNDYLHFGHRPQLPSFKACFKSVFQLHTETCNIWTHIIGCLLMLGLFISFIVQSPLASNWDAVITFGVFFLCAMLCLGCSATFHAVSCHSEKTVKLFSKLDYCGISLLIVGSFVPWVYFGFYCDFMTKTIYTGGVSFLGACAMIVSMMDRFGEKHFRPIRATVFAVFGLSGVVPGVHWLINQGYRAWVIDSLRTSFFLLVLMGVLYIAGAVLYACRIPERFFPGKCDIWFHSHQIFHVLVVAAAFVHYYGIHELAHFRIFKANQPCEMLTPCNVS